MAGPFKMKGSPMQRNFGVGSPVRKDDKTWVSKSGKKAFISSDGGNTITKKKDGGIFNPNTTKSKTVNLTTGTTTMVKENIKTGKKTTTTRKTNKGDERTVKKGRKKTS